MHIRKWLCMTLLIGWAAAMAPPARADNQQFADFFQVITGAKPFRFVNSGGTAHFGTYTSAGAVTSTNVDLQVGLNIYVTNLVMTSQVNGNATQTGSFASQNLKNISLVFTNPVSHVVLFKAMASFGGLTGGSTPTGSSSAALNAFDPTDMVTYYADPSLGLSFIPPDDFGLSFSGFSGPFKKSGNYLGNFTASGVGNFASTVPEAATSVSLGLMFAGTVLLGIRGQRGRRGVSALMSAC
jgi:hypothetical protein